MRSQEININSTILGLKEGAGWGRMGEGHGPERLNIVKK